MKTAKKKIAPKKADRTEQSCAVSLVGTYKEKQLVWIKKNGVYNYPIKDEDELKPSSKEGKEVVRQVKQRQNQSIFRQIVLRNYGGVCCVSGLPVQQILRASHIIGWAENKETRLYPSNGLCLSATYDAAFDRHLISFDEDLRMILAPSLREYYTNCEFQSVFCAYEGKRIAPARKFQPAQEFLAVHRSKMK